MSLALRKVNTMSTATRKSRGLAEVTPYLNPQGLPRCKVTLLSGEVVPLHDLNRPELAEAARLVFPELPGNAWLRLDSDTIQTLVRTANHEEAARVIEEKGARLVKKDGNGPAISPAEQAILDAVRAATASSPVAIDEDAIRGIVREELDARAPRELQVIGPSAKVTLSHSTHEVFELVLALADARENILLVGPAGSGKSTVAEHIAEALGLPFYAVSFGPTTPTSKLFGYMDANGNAVETDTLRGFRDGGVILWDELDNGHPGLIAETNQMSANGYAAFAGGMVKRHPDCIIIATANTYGLGPDRMFVGRNILDAATLDRFWAVETPIDEALETRLASAYKGASPEVDAQIDEWITYVQGVRARIYDHKLPVVCSPRAVIGGAKMLSRGMDRKAVEAARLFKGLSEDVVSKIR